LLDGGRDYRTLRCARDGLRPFCGLPAALVFWWTRRAAGAEAAVIPTLLFTSLPRILGHAGLATTDMAACACLFAAVCALVAWLEQPGWRQSFALGAGTGAALLAKFSALLFLPVCVTIAVACYAASRRGLLRSENFRR